MTQTTLDFDRPVSPRDPNVDGLDVPRLTGQNAAILARLKAGPATNAELAAISLKYTSRVSDIRAAGFVVRSTRIDGGTWRYWLEAK